MILEIPDHLINELMFHGMLRLIAMAKRGRHTNAVIRKDGVETPYEADWIKHIRIIDPYCPRAGMDYSRNESSPERVTPTPPEE